MRLPINTMTNREGQTFYYVPIGRLRDGRPAFLLWIPEILATHAPFIEFPIANHRLWKTGRGNWVLRREPGHIFYIELKFNAWLTVIGPSKVVLAPFAVYEGEKHRVGALISVPMWDGVKLRWVRDTKVGDIIIDGGEIMQGHEWIKWEWE